MSDSIFSDERFLQLILQASPAGMVIANGKGIIVLANPEAERIFGYSSGEMLGLAVERLIPEAHRRHHVAHRERYTAHPEPRPMAAGRDLFAERKDGSQVAVDISLHPLHTDRGAFVLANILDATERRKAQRRQESQQAMERLALLGQLAGGVAHEIRTPLCVIRNNVYFLRILAEKLGAEGSDCLEEVNDAVGKAERIVSELLEYARDTSRHRQIVMVTELIQGAIGQLNFPAGITVSQPHPSSETRVSVDRDQVERILINLLRNAVQALQERGSIDIRATSAGGRVSIEVADTGPGVSPEAKEQVFEPLYTTKSSGIGLGLALSKRYAHANDGDLIVIDNPGGGACFRLTLPLHAGNSEHD